MNKSCIASSLKKGSVLFFAHPVVFDASKLSTVYVVKSPVLGLQGRQNEQSSLGSFLVLFSNFLLGTKMELTMYHNGPDMYQTNEFHYCVMNILDGPAL